MCTNEPYALGHAKNRERLIQLLSMRRAGKRATAAYRTLKQAAMRQYRVLTQEACILHGKNKYQ